MNLTLRGSEDTVELADSVFGTAFNESLVHQITRSYISNGHTGTKAQKSRSDVRASGRKPWRQKGTGRARAGTTASPIWRGGGVTFAAKPMHTEQKVNRKMYRAAMRSIISELIRQDRFTPIAEFALPTPHTKTLLTELDKLQLANVLLVDTEVSENLEKAAANLHHVEVIPVSHVNPISLLSHDAVAVTVSALKNLEARLA